MKALKDWIIAALLATPILWAVWQYADGVLTPQLPLIEDLCR